MDKVASSPALALSEGWPVEETAVLSENEVAALGVALGVGMSVNANNDETPERHTLADLANLDATTLALPVVPHMETLSDIGEPLQPLIEASSEDSSPSGEGPSDDGGKVASFYIGDEHGCTRDLPPPVPDVVAVLPSSSPPPRRQSMTTRRVQIQEAPRSTVEFVPPDGGYGWVVAAAACFVNVWIVGFIKSYGVLFLPIANAFPDASAYHASWLPALLATLGLIIAPVTGVLCRRFTSRKVAFIGGLFSFLGLLLGSQATTMNQLIVATGVLTGLGAGLTTTPSILIVSLYFEKRRALASAICVSGNALGGFILPPVVDLLLSTYGLRGTLLVLAAMQLHICAAALLFRPIRTHALIQARTRGHIKDQDVEDAPVPEHNKLLPNTPASPRPQAIGFATSAPNTPLSRPHAIWNKVVRRRLTSASVTEEDEVLAKQVLFLRSSSMVNSIPDLTHYARSWSVQYDRASLGSRSSSIRLALGSNKSLSRGSKMSLSRASLGASSKLSLNRLVMGSESRRSTLTRLPSDAEERTMRHPTLTRLASEDEGRTTTSRVSSTRRFSDGRMTRVPSARSLESRVQRQPSTRRVQSRIMDAVKELDTDSQTSDELEEGQLPELKTQDSVVEKDSEMPRVPDVEVDLVTCPAPITDAPTQECCPAPINDAPTKDVTDVSSIGEVQIVLTEECKDEDDDPEVLVKQPNCCFTFCSSCIDFSLLRNPLFLLMALSVFFMAAGAPHAIFFLPAYANSVDIPSSQTPHMLSILSIVDLCGRLGVGFVSDLGICRNSHLYFISALASGVSTLMIPQMTTFASLSATLGLYGYGVGSWFVLIPTLLAQHHGANRLAASYGVVRLFHGIMNFTSPQISGLMIDSTGEFRSCYYFMGTCMALSAAIVLLEPLLISRYAVKKPAAPKPSQDQQIKTQV